MRRENMTDFARRASAARQLGDRQSRDQRTVITVGIAGPWSHSPRGQCVKPISELREACRGMRVPRRVAVTGGEFLPRHPSCGCATRGDLAKQ